MPLSFLEPNGNNPFKTQLKLRIRELDWAVKITTGFSDRFKQLLLLSKYRKFRKFTLVGKLGYVDSLLLAKKFRNVEGTVVECGVWRGGMIAGMASVLGDDKEYFLLDSFEGLPPAKDIDGKAALRYQKDVNSPVYYDNCKAEIEYAEKAMKLAGVHKAHFIKGWFNETLPQLSLDPKLCPISILRLDADWYESTFLCLSHLYPLVAEHGVIIIDDYYAYDGCSRAVHDYLSKNKLPVRIDKTKSGTCYIVKTSEGAP